MTDIVVIRFNRNAANQRIIRAFRVIGSATPCRGFLVLGNRVQAAERCLLNNGFRRALAERDVLVFIRRR